MSDFLRNLRSSHKKDSPHHPRRSFDGHYHPQTERRRIPDRRSNHSEEKEKLWSALNDLLPLITDNITQIADTLEKKSKEDSLLTEAKIRQYNSTAQFFDNLNRLFSDDQLMSFSRKMPKATASYASGTHYTKDDILSIINEMRKEGATFAVIAAYLKGKGIPTFSGRGEWHAQTIHRLCK